MGRGARRAIAASPIRAALALGVGHEAGPLGIEPLTEQRGFFGRLGRLDQAQRIAGRQPEPIGAERKRAEKRLQRACFAIAQDERALRNGAEGSPHLGLVLEPLREPPCKPARLQTVARGAIGVRAQQREIRTGGRQHQAGTRDRGQFLQHLGEGEERQRRCDNVELAPRLEPWAQQVDDAVRARVSDKLHEPPPAVSAFWTLASMRGRRS